MNKYPARIERVIDLSNSLGKLPPQDESIEEVILGAILIDKNAIVEVASILKPDHFYIESNKIIYEAILSIFSAGEKIDMRTVINAIRKAGKIELVGGGLQNC